MSSAYIEENSSRNMCSARIKIFLYIQKMKLLTYAFLFNSVKVPVHTQHNINILICEYDIDCDLPMKCCSGFIFDYCCDNSGRLKKTDKSFQTLQYQTYRNYYLIGFRIRFRWRPEKNPVIDSFFFQIRKGCFFYLYLVNVCIVNCFDE